MADSAGVGRSGYVVRVFNGADGSGAEWGNATTNAGGDATFYLVDGAYGYRVDKAGATGTKVGFTVAPAGPTPNNQTLTYTLATVVVHVADSAGAGRSGYVVRVFNGVDGSGAEWGNATTNAGGDATFCLLPGQYQYQIQKGTYVSVRLPAGGLVIAVGENRVLSHIVP